MTRTQVGPRALAEIDTWRFPQLPLFLWVYFSSPSLIPDGSLEHKNNSNASTVVRQPALWKWGSWSGQLDHPGLFSEKRSPPLVVTYPSWLLPSGVAGREQDFHPPHPESPASSFWCLASRLP